MNPDSINDGGSAFPAVENWRVGSGMTLRDYFAAKAMQGLVAQSLGTAISSGKADIEVGVQFAYRMADAMIKARSA